MNEALELLPPAESWVLRARSEVPLWIAMPQHGRIRGRAAWTELLHAVFFGDPDQAVVVAVRIGGPTWGELLTVQHGTDAHLEYALWFADCWDEACAVSHLDPAEAIAMPAEDLGAAFRRGILAQPGAQRLRVGPAWIQRSQVLATWALAVRGNLHEAIDSR